MTTRTFNYLLNLFYDDKFTSNYFWNNLKEEEMYWFYDKINKHPNKYFGGRMLTNNQQYVITEVFNLVLCKRDDCKIYHSKFQVKFCDNCINYGKYDIKYKKTKTDIFCGICISNVEKKTKHAVLKCNHCFHKECIRKWLTKKLTCPYCRENVV